MNLHQILEVIRQRKDSIKHRADALNGDGTMSYDNLEEYGVYLDNGEQEIRFPVGLAFDAEEIPEGKWAPIKTLEEAAELTEAIKDQLKAQDDPNADYEQLRQHSLDEFCDVYQTLVNIAYRFGFSQTDIEEAYLRVVHHNDERGRYPEPEESWIG